MGVAEDDERHLSVMQVEAEWTRAAACANVDPRVLARGRRERTRRLTPTAAGTVRNRDVRASVWRRGHGEPARDASRVDQCHVRRLGRRPLCSAGHHDRPRHGAQLPDRSGVGRGGPGPRSEPAGGKARSARAASAAGGHRGAGARARRGTRVAVQPPRMHLHHTPRRRRPAGRSAGAPADSSCTKASHTAGRASAVWWLPHTTSISTPALRTRPRAANTSGCRRAMALSEAAAVSSAGRSKLSPSSTMLRSASGRVSAITPRNSTRAAAVPGGPVRDPGAGR